MDHSSNGAKDGKTPELFGPGELQGTWGPASRQIDDLPHCAAVHAPLAQRRTCPPTPGSDETMLLRRLVHDLLGPLRALEDIPAWLMEDLDSAEVPLTDDMARMLPLLAENAARLRGLVHGVGAWVSAGDAPSDQAPITDLHAILDELPAAPAKIGRFEVTGLPLVAADLREILRHAISNAVRFHPTGAPVVQIQGQADGADWCLRITDDGPGLPVPDGATLTPPLMRAAVGTRPAGAGFGLAIIDRIAQRYGAETRLSTRPDRRGTCLELVGPLHM